MTSRTTHKLLFASVFVAGFAARLYVATFGDNQDHEAWDLIARIVLDGKSVYASTFRNSWGPTWSCTLALLKLVQWSIGLDDVSSLHVIASAFLALVDAAIALLLARFYGAFVGLLFFLSP